MIVKQIPLNCQHHRKCLENRMESKHTDDKVSMGKALSHQNEGGGCRMNVGFHPILTACF